MDYDQGGFLIQFLISRDILLHNFHNILDSRPFENTVWHIRMFLLKGLDPIVAPCRPIFPSWNSAASVTTNRISAYGFTPLPNSAIWMLFRISHLIELLPNLLLVSYYHNSLFKRNRLNLHKKLLNWNRIRCVKSTYKDLTFLQSLDILVT